MSITAVVFRDSRPWILLHNHQNRGKELRPPWAYNRGYLHILNIKEVRSSPEMLTTMYQRTRRHIEKNLGITCVIYIFFNTWFRASWFNVNKGPTRCNSMQTFIHCHVTLHVSGVTHPSSGVLKTVSATSGVCHGNGTVTSFHLGLIRTGVKKKWLQPFKTRIKSHLLFAGIIRSSPFSPR